MGMGTQADDVRILLLCFLEMMTMNGRAVVPGRFSIEKENKEIL